MEKKGTKKGGESMQIELTQVVLFGNFSML